MPKTVLITGGSSGVGAELVRVFTERGYIVWFTYNSGRSRADTLLDSLPRGSNAKVSLSSQERNSCTGKLHTSSMNFMHVRAAAFSAYSMDDVSVLTKLYTHTAHNDVCQAMMPTQSTTDRINQFCFRLMNRNEQRI